MKRILAICAVLCLALFGLPGFSAAEHQDSLVIVNSSWAPYKGEKLPEGGIATHITKEALVRAGYQVKVVSAPWKRALRGAYAGTYDVVPAIWHTPERAEMLEFGSSVMTSRIVIISRRDYDFEFNSLADLQGKVVGVAAGWAYSEEFKQAEDIIRDESLNLETILKKIMFGRIKLGIAEEFAARYTASTMFPEAVGLLRYSKKTLEEKELYVAFSKKRADHMELTRRFNQAVAAMRADGSYEAILKFHNVSQSGDSTTGSD